MKKYRDLNLKKIREACDLDFAHYTYRKGQCSCCYGPQDMASLYWRDRIIQTGNNFTYILFKNAYNGSGRITSKDEPITDYTCIEYRLKTLEQKDAVCKALLEQLGPAYVVAKPKADLSCIIIYTLQGYNNRCTDNDFRFTFLHYPEEFNR